MHVFSSDILLLTHHSSINNTTLPNDPTSHLNKCCKSNRIIPGHTFCPATQHRCTPTYSAAAYGHTEVVKALIGANADVNAASKVKQMHVLALRLTLRRFPARVPLPPLAHTLMLCLCVSVCLRLCM